MMWHEKLFDDIWTERSALHIAVQLGHESVVKKLIENKCNLDLRDKDGRSALVLAYKLGKKLHKNWIELKIRNVKKEKEKTKQRMNGWDLMYFWFVLLLNCCEYAPHTHHFIFYVFVIVFLCNKNNRTRTNCELFDK